jgi:hypothetical protein
MFGSVFKLTRSRSLFLSLVRISRCEGSFDLLGPTTLRKRYEVWKALISSPSGTSELFPMISDDSGVSKIDDLLPMESRVTMFFSPGNTIRSRDLRN